MRRTDHKNGTPSEARRPRLVIVYILLFNRSKGHGSGCTTALIGMHRYPYRVLFNTAHLPVQWHHTKSAQLNGGTNSKTVICTSIFGKKNN